MTRSEKKNLSNSTNGNYGSLPVAVKNGDSHLTVQDSTAVSRSSSPRVYCLYAAIFVGVVFLAASSLNFYEKPSRQIKKNSVQKVQRTPFHETIKDIPFPHIDRSDYNIPADQVVNPNLFAPSLRNDLDCEDGECKPTSYAGKSLLKVPMPTGAFWTNLVLPQVTGTGASFPIMVYPFAYSWASDRLEYSYPSLRRIMDKLSIRDIVNADITYRTQESVQSRYITEFDPLSVTLRFNVDDSKYWETYLVQGSPWTTFRYKNTTPVLHALSVYLGMDCLPYTDCEIDYFDPEKLARGEVPYQLTGTKFKVVGQGNVDYLVVSSKTVTLQLDVIRKTEVVFSEPFDGVVRVAPLPPKQDNFFDYTNTFPSVYEWLNTYKSTGLDVLLKTSNMYPVRANIDWEFEPAYTNKMNHMEENSVAKLQFKYETKSLFDDPDLPASTECNDELIMLALPHHTQILKNVMYESDEFSLLYRTMKGYTTAVSGSCWVMEEKLTDVWFDSPSSLQRALNVNDTVRETIINSIEFDMTRVLPTNSENVYGFGKQVARLAQLTYITSIMKNDEETESTFENLMNLLGSHLVDYLIGDFRDKLVYDTNLGGMVSSDGLKNSGMDFGNGWYNDHHFHYGYVLYACGIYGKLNNTFASEYGTHIDAIMYDVVYSENHNSKDIQDSATFPFVRHKSWYDGHSYASGLFSFADGKSQESSTESINCYYGAYLWSSVRQPYESDVTNFARLLLATEIRSVKLYWHMNPDGNAHNVLNDGQIYNPLFAKNLMVGNSAMMDVTVTTWFGTKDLYVHMINFMPITAITREVFDKSYIENEFSTTIKPIYDDIEMAWKGYAVCDRAMIEPKEAWEDALTLRSAELDQAISLSQILYFIATMEGFSMDSDAESDNTVEVTPSPTNAPTKLKENEASCAANFKCKNLGLEGTCCPTQSGVILSCCNYV